MPTKLTTASCSRARRSSTPRWLMSASTTSTVGRRIRCFARSRRREGTVTRNPRLTSSATRCRPTKPDPPRTSTLRYLILRSFRQLFVGRIAAAARRDGAQARLERHDLLLDQRGVEDRVGHHLLHVIARL